MKELNISKDFTIEDIHAVREYNAERRKKLTLEERIEDIKKRANECEQDIEKYRNKELAI